MDARRDPRPPHPHPRSMPWKRTPKRTSAVRKPAEYVANQGGQSLMETTQPPEAYSPRP